MHFFSFVVGRQLNPRDQFNAGFFCSRAGILQTADGIMVSQGKGMKPHLLCKCDKFARCVRAIGFCRMYM